jgi:hypothetical protein
MLPLCHAQRLFEPGPHEMETGYGRSPDGSVFVSVLTDMPGVSPAMWDWWFGWHGDEPQRYKLWHPQAHLYAKWNRPPVATAKSDRDRYLGRTSIVDEYIGSKLSRLAIRFLPVQDLGISTADIADRSQATAICARVGLADMPMDAGFLIHQVRATSSGSQMRSRFWIGGPHLAVRGGNKASAAILRQFGRVKTFPEAQARDLMVHCSQEMSHLAGFLPRLWADYRHRGEPN